MLKKCVKPKPISDAKPSDAEEIVPSPEKKQEILNNLTLIKMEHQKISILLGNSTASKLVTRKRIGVNDLFGGQHYAKKI